MFENPPHASRHELVDGWLYAMVSETLRHERIALNLAAALSAHLAGGACRPYKGDLKLRLGDGFHYPDTIVRCDDESQGDGADLHIERLGFRIRLADLYL